MLLPFEFIGICGPYLLTRFAGQAIVPAGIQIEQRRGKEELSFGIVLASERTDFIYRDDALDMLGTGSAMRAFEIGCQIHTISPYD
jgi:hypothetical protein